MEEFPWECDADGVLLGARAHDAVLSVLHFERKRLLQITFVRIDGTSVKLIYEGVTIASIGPIWDTSVLNSAFVWLSDKVPFSDAKDVGWNALFAKRVVPTDIEKEVQGITSSSEKYMLSVLGFAHGASIAVLFKNLRIFDLDNSV